MEGKRTGLVLEGGAMRGLFTCGVTDVMMENGVGFDGIVGVSAGAAFGVNYKSHQPGRAVRYNKKYCGDKRYGTFRSLLRTGDLYDADFCYREIPDELDLFDRETFAADGTDFYVVCTDVDTGEAVYHLCGDGGEEDILWMRASASMPGAANIVEAGGRRLLDGGVADSIPVKFFEKLGYERLVVVLTQPRGYVKGKNSLLPLLGLKLHGAPQLLETMRNRHLRYNETTEYIARRESEGALFVLRPPEPLGIGRTEKNPDELERVYRLGRKTMAARLDELKRYLA